MITYVAQEGKKPLYDYDGGKGLVYTELNNENFKDIGRLLNDDIIVIDIDNIPFEILDQMIKLFNIDNEMYKTSRGYHIYCKKPKFKVDSISLSMLGAKIEYKTSKTNRCTTVKLDGVLRPHFNPGNIKPIPSLLLPRATKDDLGNLSEGQGRNNELFKHLGACRRAGIMKKDQLLFIANFVNKYIFKEPLDDSEITAMIDSGEKSFDGEAVRGWSFDDKGRCVGELIDEIKRETGDKMPSNSMPHSTLEAYLWNKEIQLTSFGGDIFKKVGNHFERTTEDELSYEAVNKYVSASNTFIKEVIGRMLLSIKPQNLNDEYPLILKNGYLFDGKFHYGEYPGFSPYFVNINYNQHVKPCNDVEMFLNLLTDGRNDDGKGRSWRDDYLKALSHILITETRILAGVRRFFILKGKGNNMKTVTLNLIEHWLGEENVSNVPLSKLGDDNMKQTLSTKLLNVNDDLVDSKIRAEEIEQLKKLATGSKQSIRTIYRSGSSIKPRASMFLSVNQLASQGVKDPALNDRMTIIYFSKVIDEFIPDLNAKLSTEHAKEYMLKLMIDKYIEMGKTMKYTFSDFTNNELEKYQEQNNPVEEYVKSTEKEAFIGKNKGDILEEYEIYCRDNGIEKPNSKQLYLAIELIYDLEYKQVRTGDLRGQRVYQ